MHSAEPPSSPTELPVPVPWRLRPDPPGGGYSVFSRRPLPPPSSLRTPDFVPMPRPSGPLPAWVSPRSDGMDAGRPAGPSAAASSSGAPAMTYAGVAKGSIASPADASAAPGIAAPSATAAAPGIAAAVVSPAGDVAMAPTAAGHPSASSYEPPGSLITPEQAAFIGTVAQMLASLAGSVPRLP